MNARSARNLLALLALFTSASVAPLAVAQTAAASEPTEGDNTLKLDKLVVTGSYIPMAADALATPVTVVGLPEIERTGVTTNVLDVLKKAVPQFTGNANIGSNNANISSGSTGGGSQASLRNLTTLTLINGRRAAVSPISGTGGNQFVDLNIIPLAAVDSIEVLMDGASATYGSDATSGVINIKTRANYNGVALSGFYEWTDQTGNWANRGSNFVVGAGNGKTNITVAGGWSKSDPLWQFEREYSNPQYGTPTFGGVINFGGNYFVLNPAYSAPPVGATKPTVSFTGTSLSSIPVAPDGKAYFGAIDSPAYYWGKATTAGAGVGGFGAGELAFASSPEAEQVAFNLANYVTILQRRESRGAITTFDHTVNDQIEFFGDLMVSVTNTFSQINAQPVGTTTAFNVTSAHINNPFNNTLRVRNRFVANPRQYLYDTNFVRAVMGFRGQINDRLSYETAINLNRSDLSYQNPGVISSSGLLGAAGISPAATTAPTPINMFQRDVPNSAVASANFVGVAYNDFTSELRSWDGRMVYNAFSMASGDIVIAVGGEYRIEALKGTADLNSIPNGETGAIGWTGATSVNPFKAKRDVTAMFAEVQVPLASPKQDLAWAHAMEIGAAVRHEKYSDTEDPTVPKFTLRWLPFNDEFAVRGSYGESFNAPTLYQLFGPSDVGFTPSVVLLPYGQPDEEDNYVGGQAQIRGGSNPGLSPAESKSMTFGMDWSPKAIKGLILKATYYSIEEENIVGVISSQGMLQDVEDNGPNSDFLAQNAGPNNASGNFINPVTGKSLYDVRIEGFRANGDPITAPGQVANNIDSIYIDRPLVNIATQETSGIDFTAQYKWDVASVGLIDISSTVAYVLDYKFGSEDIGGKATVTGGTIPEWQSYTSFGWTRGNISAYVANRFVPKTEAPDELSSGKTHAEQYSEWDIGVAYTFDGRWMKALNGLKVSLAVNNVGNEAAPQLPDTFANDSIDTGMYDPIGRRFVISAEYKF